MTVVRNARLATLRTTVHYLGLLIGRGGLLLLGLLLLGSPTGVLGIWRTANQSVASATPTDGSVLVSHDTPPVHFTLDHYSIRIEKSKELLIIIQMLVILIARDSEAVSREAHNLEIGGAIPSPATKMYNVVYRGWVAQAVRAVPS